MPAPQHHSLSPQRALLREARTCYDHLAGAHSVALAKWLEDHGMLRAVSEHRYELSAQGQRWFLAALQIDVAAFAAGRRPLARRCLDWTERQPHLAGSLGAAVLARLLSQRYVSRIRGTRALRITPCGSAFFARLADTRANASAEAR